MSPRYCAYAGYFDAEIDSVNTVDPMKSSVSSTGPTIVGLITPPQNPASAETAAVAPSA
jgi:hypothetical protein